MSRKKKDFGEVGRNRDQSEELLIAPFQTRNDIDFLVQEMGKRMIPVHNLWREHRKNLFFEVFFNIFFLWILKLLERKTADTVWTEPFFNLRVGLIPLLIKRLHRLVNPF